MLRGSMEQHGAARSSAADSAQRRHVSLALCPAQEMPEEEDVPDDLDEALALRRGPGSRFTLVCGLTPALFAGVCVCRRVVFFGFFFLSRNSLQFSLSLALRLASPQHRTPGTVVCHSIEAALQPA